jgi:hypothetical protein
MHRLFCFDGCNKHSSHAKGLKELNHYVKNLRQKELVSQVIH